ncbi:hypothetical protein BT96DRAFT_939433 [Gymnopus androsaceus JB14]|uniref:Uncharacterized protein n=1 Tax=Gymnopus androsaceus JB14 TaxID=1447944 RepID=A0A6A4HRH3_9AGAR|nr:hypothetical protein BT96DRAFT_939433 [Gymnopus androsaceus JB14]
MPVTRSQTRKEKEAVESAPTSSPTNPPRSLVQPKRRKAKVKVPTIASGDSSSTPTTSSAPIAPAPDPHPYDLQRETMISSSPELLASAVVESGSTSCFEASMILDEDARVILENPDLLSGPRVPILIRLAAMAFRNFDEFHHLQKEMTTEVVRSIVHRSRPHQAATLENAESDADLVTELWDVTRGLLERIEILADCTALPDYMVEQVILIDSISDEQWGAFWANYPQFSFEVPFNPPEASATEEIKHMEMQLLDDFVNMDMATLMEPPTMLY